MKTRFKNYITSTVGALIMLSALAMFILDRLGKIEFSFMEFLLVVILGWVFLSAKDTLLEGLFFKLFKIKKPE